MKANYNSLRPDDDIRGRPIELQSDSGEIIWGQLSISEALDLMSSLKTEISKAKENLDEQIDKELEEV